MNLRSRWYQPELLDADDVPFEDIKQNMQELNFINTWLGGHAISVAGLRKLVGTQKQVLVCELGCGGGDNIVALSNWCQHHQVSARFIGIDQKEACITFASSRTALQGIEWRVSDYRQVEFEHKPDIIFSSLFCHHFNNEQLIGQLQWMKKNSRIGFFINDLHRNSLAYYLIKVLTRFFSSSYLVKNDAPLSVARAFKKRDWIMLMNKADLKNYSLQWKWAFRYLLTYQNG